jgi:nuclear mRNA export protein SAC3
MDDFRVYMVDDMLKKLYDNFVEEQEEQFRKEEHERDIAQADALRTYNLSMRYFYRWKDNAREKRLRQLRRNGREQARAFYEAQRQAEIRRQEDAARQAAKDRKLKAELDRPRELMEVLRNHKVSKREAEEALLASGVLAGVGNEREAAARIVRRELNRTVSGERRNSTSRQSSPGAPHKGGSKTQALREELLRNKSVGFRRSLPSLSPQSTGSPEASASRPSQASERWRLKAMGIVQMPDGTAMPESIAYEMLNGGVKYKGMGRSSSVYGASTRRASFTGAATNGDGNVLARSTESPTSDPVQKRKRTAEDDGRALMDGDGKANAHKRVMSEAEALINELRSMRQEMEEGTTWFKSQNERLQSEVRSRDTTPWDGSI